jgi:hypothetical protein
VRWEGAHETNGGPDQWPNAWDTVGFLKAPGAITRDVGMQLDKRRKARDDTQSAEIRPDKQSWSPSVRRLVTSSTEN